MNEINPQMNEINPQSFAKVIPTKESEVIFQYEICLDTSYDSPQMLINDLIKINTDTAQLPYQFLKVFYKVPGDQAAGQRWNIGFNFYKEGEDLWYQSFYWRGDNPPGKSRIQNGGEFQEVSAAVRLEKNVGTVVEVVLGTFDWLKCLVRPVDVNFELAINSASVNTNPANPTPQIAKTTEIANERDKPSTYTPQIIYAFNQIITTSVTDTHSLTAGLKLTWSGTVGWFVAKSKFSVEVSLEYSSSSSATSTKSTTETYSVNEIINVTLDPHTSAYVSLILYSDTDATADIVMELVLKGKLNGAPITGTYLEQILLGMSHTNILSRTDYTVTYQLTGTINANIVSHTNIIITDHPPTLQDLEMATPISRN